MHYANMANRIVNMIAFLEGRNPVQPECEQKD